MALRVAELRLLGAWTAAIWGRAQSAPHEQILAEASRRADADFTMGGGVKTLDLMLHFDGGDQL